MSRICIYLTYDKQNIIDKYIGYMLKELKSCVDFLAVVCNETEIICGIEILEKYADEIFYRENIGFDVGGFKDALCSFIGWDKVLKYDELVLVNDSMFGPFKPMKEIFEEMDEKKVDFWGLAKHGEGKDDSHGNIAEHIQTYFLTVCYKMLHSHPFRRYWEEIPYYTNFHDVVCQHELKFTQFFASLGYTYASLANTEINDSINICNNYSQYSFLPYELIKKRNFPFLKRKPICWDNLYCQTQENLRLSIDYIDKMTKYDINLIWDNIIRIMNMSDLYYNLHLQYIVTPEKNYKVYKNILILVFITNWESFETVLEYLEWKREKYNIKIISKHKDYIEIYQEHGFECRVIDTNNILKLLVEYSIYDLVCVLHDRDITSNKRPSYIGKSCFYNIWENLVKNENYIASICKLFDEESKLGFLAPPQLNFGEYFGEYTRGWDGNFDKVQQVVLEAGINCQLSEFNSPFTITENFWIRGSILQKLDSLKQKDISILPYIWIYLVQDSGFYSGIVVSTQYASMNNVNEHYYLRKLLPQIKRQYGEFDTFFELREELLVRALQEFCGKYSRVFVYGTGEMMQIRKRLFKGIEAYLVSPGHIKLDEIDGVPVKYISEISSPEDCGIVLCLNERNQQQVIPLLKKYGFNHYFCM